jgi:hypothetical protein
MKQRGHTMEMARFRRGALQVLWRGITLVALAVFAAAPAWAQYDLSWFTIDGGGAMQTMGGPYTLNGTIGQPDAGLLAGGTYILSGGFWRSGSAVVGVGDDETQELPLSFRLHAAAPNPLSRHTVIAFDLPQPQSVRVHVYDATGRLARTLAEGPFLAGRHQRVWDGTDDHGQPIGAGIYFVRFDTETFQSRQKIVVLR